MSKTYRRKNKHWDFSSYDYSWDLGFLQTVRMDLKSLSYKQKKAKYHSDSYTGWCVPHWYVNMFHERPYRQHVKKEIHKWSKNPENYEILIHRHMKNAGWNYW